MIIIIITKEEPKENEIWRRKLTICMTTKICLKIANWMTKVDRIFEKNESRITRRILIKYQTNWKEKSRKTKAQLVK